MTVSLVFYIIHETASWNAFGLHETMKEYNTEHIKFRVLLNMTQKDTTHTYGCPCCAI